MAWTARQYSSPEPPGRHLDASGEMAQQNLTEMAAYGASRTATQSFGDCPGL